MFSWAFLDWATQQGIGHDHVELYGLDHSPAMINLARMVRDKLAKRIDIYPDIHYCHEVDALLRQLTDNHRPDTGYIITFGHVLAQAHTPDAIQNFRRIIAHAHGLIDPRSNCVLMAVDAKTYAPQFTKGWSLLLNALESAGISYQQHEVPKTPINNGDRAKLALLYPAQ